MRDNSQYLPNTFRTNQNGARPPPERPFIFFMQFVSKIYIQKCLMVKVRHIFLISDYSNLIQIYGISGSTK